MRFFRFLNPFATIRALRSELADTQYRLSLATDTAFFLRQQRSSLEKGLILADRVVDEHMADREALQAEIAEQAADTVEVISYVKQVEARLALAGITIEDGEAGPMVVVEQASFLASIRNGKPDFAAGKVLLA